jgi:putative ABC transport system permease protein
MVVAHKGNFSMFSGQMFEIIRLAVRNIRLHKLRSLLTTLGIICGVGAVICMLSITEGASEAEMALIRLLGTQNIIVQSVKPEKSADMGQEQSYLLVYGLTDTDLLRIRSTLPAIERVVPLREVAFEVSYGAKGFPGTVIGADPAFFDVLHVEMEVGVPLQPYHHESEAKVCVIGSDVRDRLFAFEDPIGQSISVNSDLGGAIPFEVIGVLQAVATAGAPAKGLGGRDMNSEIYIPLSTADQRYGDLLVKRASGSREYNVCTYSDFYIQVASLEDVIPVSQAVGRLMEFGHPDMDYAVRVPLERLQIAEKKKQQRRITLGCIAGISLLVGGIGIMNIMLATVTERTREIGIRRALGAKRRHITLQFLVESVVLTTAGGVIGVAAGWMGALGITKYVEWPTVIHPWTVLVSFGLAVAVGVFFGIYPAAAAARLDPIEALRHE